MSPRDSSGMAALSPQKLNKEEGPAWISLALAWLSRPFLLLTCASTDSTVDTGQAVGGEAPHPNSSVSLATITKATHAESPTGFIET